MAKLYIKKSDGTYVPQNSQSVTNIDVVQTTGTSTTSVMSQKATTDELAKKANLNRRTIWIPVASALLIWLLGVSPILIILVAGLSGFLVGRKKK